MGRLELVLNISLNQASRPLFAGTEGTCESYRNRWQLWALSSFENHTTFWVLRSEWSEQRFQWWWDILTCPELSVFHQSNKVKVGRDQEAGKIWDSLVGQIRDFSALYSLISGGNQEERAEQDKHTASIQPSARCSPDTFWAGAAISASHSTWWFLFYTFLWLLFVLCRRLLNDATKHCTAWQYSAWGIMSSIGFAPASC